MKLDDVTNSMYAEPCVEKSDLWKNRLDVASSILAVDQNYKVSQYSA